MDNELGRPNQRMRELVEDVLRRQEDIGRRHAAAEMLRADVPLPVICRVLDPNGQRHRRSVLPE